ncbi:MAG: nicotinate-nicotinamide nucleotide adenylyltransferase, partial [Acidobacteriaceae bacterium]|nr:nicotinate-nicotinamide nucleotide adenylyltransferase [Acidobacteriaceae bacterium]
RLVCAADARFAASSIDAPHADGSPNYTFETLEALRREHPRARLFAIAGADSFLTLPEWRHPERLLELSEWIVVSRPGFRLEEIEALGFAPEQRARVHLLGAVHEDISATELRRQLAERESCAGWIPEGVARYIAEHGLYGVRKQGS